MDAGPFWNEWYSVFEHKLDANAKSLHIFYVTIKLNCFLGVMYTFYSFRVFVVRNGDPHLLPDSPLRSSFRRSQNKKPITSSFHWRTRIRNKHRAFAMHLYFVWLERKKFVHNLYHHIGLSRVTRAHEKLRFERNPFELFSCE